MQLMSMKPVGGVEILGPATNPQKFLKVGGTQGCAQDTEAKGTDLDFQNDLPNCLDLCHPQHGNVSNVILSQDETSFQVLPYKLLKIKAILIETDLGRQTQVCNKDVCSKEFKKV